VGETSRADQGVQLDALFMKVRPHCQHPAYELTFSGLQQFP